MDPAYFFGHLGLEEAADYIAGARKRERDAWERLRFLSNVVAKCVTGSEINMTLPWEQPTQEEVEEQTAEAMTAAKRMEEMVKAGQLKI